MLKKDENSKRDSRQSYFLKGQEMVKKNIRDYYCQVISEDVKIFLKNKVNMGLTYKKDYFATCDQEECQYVDKNVSPCPLAIEMFGAPREV